MSELERWEERFAGDEFLFGTAPNAFLARQAGLSAAGDAGAVDRRWRGAQRGLAGGAGARRAGAGLLAARAGEVARAGARPRRDAGLGAVGPRARDWEPDAFDVVVGIFFQFLAPEDRARVFDGIRRTVRPGGLVLIEGYGPKQIEYGTGGPKAVENLYTEDLLRTRVRRHVRDRGPRL